MSDCECQLAGLCERHGILKTSRMIYLCQNNPKYWAAWEAGHGPWQDGTPPPFTGRKKAPKLGPGTELEKLIAERGYSVTRECGCKDKVVQMNRWGPEGCRENLDTIVDWMIGSAKQAGLLNRIAVTAPGVKQLARLEIRKMVELAIGHAENNLV